MIKDEKCRDKVIKSRVQLLIHFPFYGTLALSLRLKEDYSIQTAGTNGKVLYYNPNFINKLTDGELNWVIAHEVMHCALGHLWRRENRIFNTWNMAADFAIHCILKETSDANSGNFNMPKDCLYDSKFNNKSTEEIYDILNKENNESSKNNSDGDDDSNNNNNDNNSSNNHGNQKLLDDHSVWNNSDSGDDDDNTQKVNASYQEMAREWQDKMINAAKVSEQKKHGSVPGSIIRIVNDLVKPQKNWKELLAEFVQMEVFDYGFLPPDKRYYGFSDVLMPDFNEETEKIQDIVFIIDTSGSIGDKELVVFYSEISGVMQQFSSVKGHVLFVDSEIGAEYDISDVDDVLQMKPAYGGGGTDMEAGIRYCIEKTRDGEWDVSGCCILTDGYTNFSLEENDIPFKTLWVLTDNDIKPPYGTCTNLEI